MTHQTASEAPTQTDDPHSPNREPIPEKSAFNFVFCEHTPEMVGRIAEALEGSDIIAIEAVGLVSDEERAYVNDLLTEYVSSSTDEKRRKEIAVEFTAEDGLNARLWYLAVLNYFSASDKKIATIDANTDSLAYEFIQASKEAAFAIDTSLKQNEPDKTTRAKLARAIKIEAESWKSRESVVVEQLRKLGSENPGSKIGVVLGAAHTGVRHALSKESDTSATYVRSSADAKVIFDYGTEAIRTLRFGRSKLGKKFLDRVLLESLSEASDRYPLKRVNMDNWDDERIKTELDRRKRLREMQ